MSAVRRRISSNALAWRYEIRELLQGIFACELLAPSGRLWLVSPWVSDIPVVDNRAGRFDLLSTDFGARDLRLAEVLGSLVRRGTAVTVVVRPIPENDSFLAQLAGEDVRRGGDPGRLQVFRTDVLHEKGLLGDDYYLSGSMNFTMNGIDLNEESVLFETTEEVVAEAHVDYAGRWPAPAT